MLNTFPVKVRKKNNNIRFNYFYSLYSYDTGKGKTK